jgi:chaperonin GroES
MTYILDLTYMLYLKYNNPEPSPAHSLLSFSGIIQTCLMPTAQLPAESQVVRPVLKIWKAAQDFNLKALAQRIRRLQQAMTTNIRPLHDRVIVKRIEEGEQARGGIIIPDTAKEKPQEGEVVAAGLGKYREDGTRQALDVKVGDRVLFGKYSSSEIKLDGQELLIMREDEILGIISRAGTAAAGSTARGSAAGGSGKKSGR